MFTKEDYNQWLKNKYDIQLNKRMIEYFPFLLPRNRWTGLVSDTYDFSYNEMINMPHGWAVAFGYEMLCELRQELLSANFLDDYRISDIKEKYGTLRWYDFGNTEKGHQIINKYCTISAHVCIMCGQPATHMTRDWVSYFCAKCGKKLDAELIPEDWWEDEDED